jgi:hypothetical protein
MGLTFTVGRWLAPKKLIIDGFGEALGTLQEVGWR